MFDDSALTEIRNRLDLVDLVSEQVSLKKAGSNYKGLCPFHSEKTPSFIVSPEKQIFHCFGCHEGGDLFSFLMKLESLTFPEAIEKLASKAGVEFQTNADQQKIKNENEILYQANRVAAWHYHETLKKSEKAEKARKYLLDRGIGEKEVERFRLGFSLNEPDELIKTFEKKNIPVKAAEKTGILKKGERGFFESFRERVIFPIFSKENKVVGLGGRILESGKETAKYINSPESPIYDKSSILFGFPLAREAIRKKNRVFIVEGYLDVLAMHQFGFEETVAPLGTALTPRQIGLLKRQVSEIIMLFDGDEAGWKATSRSLEHFLEQDLDPKVLILPSGEDPDSYLRSAGTKQFQEKLKEIRNLFTFFVDKVIAKNKRDIAGKAAIIAELKPYILKVSSPLKRNLSVRMIAEKLDIPENWVLEELGLKPVSPTRRVAKTESKSKSSSPEETLIELFLKFESVRPVIIEKVQLDDFEDEELKKIIPFLSSEKKFQNLSWNEILGKLEKKEIKSRLTALLLKETVANESNASQIATDCIDKIKKRDFKQRLKLLSGQIEEAEKQNQPDRLSILLREKQNLIGILSKEK